MQLLLATNCGCCIKIHFIVLSAEVAGIQPLITFHGFGVAALDIAIQWMGVKDHVRSWQRRLAAVRVQSWRGEHQLVPIRHVLVLSSWILYIFLVAPARFARALTFVVRA